MFGYSPVLVAGGASLLTLFVGVLFGAWYAGRGNEDETEDVFREVATDGGHLMEMKPVDSSKGYVSKKMGDMKRSRAKKKAAQSGYVRWHLVGDRFSEAKFVKPKQKGAGVPELEKDGNTYLFPESAMVPSTRDGMYTVFHRVGESDPVSIGPNEKLGDDISIKADVLKEYLDMRVTSTNPGGLLGGLGLGDMDSMDIMRYGIIAIVGFFILMEFMP